MSRPLIVPPVRHYPRMGCYGDSLTGPGQYTDTAESLLPGRVWEVRATGGGTATAVYTDMAARIGMFPELASRTTIIECGTNGGISDEENHASVAAMVALLGHRRFLIACAYNSYSQTVGSDGYIRAVGINAQYAADYPDNFVNDRAYMISLNTNPTDTANGVVGAEQTSDGLHFTVPAGVARGTFFVGELVARDW